MDPDQTFSLGDGGMRMDALAALHGIAATLAVQARAKLAAGRGRRVACQARAGDDLMKMAAALDRGDIAPLAALEWLVSHFAQVAGVIQPADLQRLLAHESADITARLTAITILPGRPDAQS